MASRKVFFINNEGEGFANAVEIERGETISGFLQRTMSDFNPSNNSIKVNGNPVEENYSLRTGDRVCVTPTKMTGNTN